jgi:hypothetical protein
MNFPLLQNLVPYVHSNSAHECGHITVLFKAGRLVGLNFLPHEVAADGAKGVLETDAGTQLGKEDCVALAAGMVGELICLGQYDSQRIHDDRQEVQRIVGRPVESFALEAYEAIKQNLLFFVLLNIEVRKKMFALLGHAFSLSQADYAKLPNVMPIITFAEVEQVYKHAESSLAAFSEKAGAP